MTRYKATNILPEACSEEHWQGLLRAANSAPDEITISNAALQDAQECEERFSKLHGEPAFRFRPMNVGRRNVYIERKQIWDFVQAHGARCGRRHS